MVIILQNVSGLLKYRGVWILSCRRLSRRLLDRCWAKHSSRYDQQLDCDRRRDCGSLLLRLRRRCVVVVCATTTTIRISTSLNKTNNKNEGKLTFHRNQILTWFISFILFLKTKSHFKTFLQSRWAKKRFWFLDSRVAARVAFVVGWRATSFRNRTRSRATRDVSLRSTSVVNVKLSFDSSMHLQVFFFLQNSSLSSLYCSHLFQREECCSRFMEVMARWIKLHIRLLQRNVDKLVRMGREDYSWFTIR